MTPKMASAYTMNVRGQSTAARDARVESELGAELGQTECTSKGAYTTRETGNHGGTIISRRISRIASMQREDAPQGKIWGRSSTEGGMDCREEMANRTT